MKQLITGIAALLLTTSVAFAQPTTRQKDKMHHPKEMAMQQLNLSEDQKAEMKAAKEDFRSKMQALRSNENQTVKQLREGQASLMKAHQQKLESILTAEQKSKLATLKAQAKQQRQQMGAKHFDKLKQELGLTDQQAAELKKGQADAKSKLAAIRNNSGLDATSKREQLKQLHQEMKNNIDKVLTPEQKQKWEGMKKNHMHHRKHPFGNKAPKQPVA
jgi:periplasmic protein CpxP/Spy